MVSSIANTNSFICTQLNGFKYNYFSQVILCFYVDMEVSPP